jgi:two-component system sensor histidine kinase KdpD
VPAPEPTTGAGTGYLRSHGRVQTVSVDDAHLAEVDEDTEGVVQAAGRFRIYLGAVAGVGKTYAMLNEGKRRLERGTDIVVGFVECHGRAHTIEMCQGFEAVPRLVVEYRGSTFEEMDLDAVLARKPTVALVDELAHTNVPGSGRHEKRWQDVLELIEAGISVITTVNIQHLESLADAVERISGIAVRERVPDWVVRSADQIELVDSSPEQLRRRMLHGNIYPREKVPQALTHFFKTENLVALRELALRFLADETDEALLEYLRRHDVTQIWETTERILVCVTGAPGTDSLLRRAARLAARLKTELHVVHVTTGDATMSQGNSAAIDALRKLSDDLGAQWDELAADDPAQAIVEYARKHQITQIVLGSSRRSRWQEMTRGEVVRRVLRNAHEAGIDVHVIARRDAPGVLAEDPEADDRQARP